MVCLASGLDHEQWMRPDARKPKPEPLVSFTRQERRRLAFALKEAKRAKGLLRSLGG